MFNFADETINVACKAAKEILITFVIQQQNTDIN
jgi:hypothetical protein